MGNGKNGEEKREEHLNLVKKEEKKKNGIEADYHSVISIQTCVYSLEASGMCV